jgi:hypothetical protein
MKKRQSQSKSKSKIILHWQVDSSLDINYVLPRGSRGDNERGRGVLSILAFLHQLVVSIIGTLIIILHLLRFVVFQYNLNNLKDTTETIRADETFVAAICLQK